jgi:hypothetical protein
LHSHTLQVSIESSVARIELFSDGGCFKFTFRFNGMFHLTNLLLILSLQAAKILANLIIAGGTVLFRAASQAYRQAIISKLILSYFILWSS